MKKVIKFSDKESKRGSTPALATSIVLSVKAVVDVRDEDGYPGEKGVNSPT